MKKSTTAQQCKSHCFKYKTEKGYLCNKMESSIGAIYKPWCLIGNNQVDQMTANGLRLPPERIPKKTLRGNQYWDYIVIPASAAKKSTDDDFSVQYCFTDLENIDSKKICSAKNKTDFVNDMRKIYWWKFASFFLCRAPIFVVKTMAFTAPITVPHFYEKFSEAGLSNKEIMKHLVDYYGEFLENIVLYGTEEDGKEVLLSQSDIEYVTRSLREEIDRAFPSNVPINDGIKDSAVQSELEGKYIKDLLANVKQHVAKFDTVAEKYSPNQSTQLIDFVLQIPDKYIFEVIRGANVILDDDGKTYDYIHDNLKGYSRFSSHKSIVPQIGVTELFLDTQFHMVSGVIMDEQSGKKRTWFQLEGTPNPEGRDFFVMLANMIIDVPHLYYNTKYFLEHATDFIVYKTVKRSIGFMGTSSITDKNPLLIEIPGISSEARDDAAGDRNDSVNSKYDSVVSSVGHSADLFIANSTKIETVVRNQMQDGLSLSPSSLSKPEQIAMIEPPLWTRHQSARPAISRAGGKRVASRRRRPTKKKNNHIRSHKKYTCRKGGSYRNDTL